MNKYYTCHKCGNPMADAEEYRNTYKIWCLHCAKDIYKKGCYQITRKEYIKLVESAKDKGRV